MRTRCLSLALGWAVVMAAAAGSDPKTLAVPPEKLTLAKELVRRLDDDDVDVRDQASADLRTMGRFALPALVEVMKGKPTNEVGLRVERLLPAARKDDFDARARVFLADKDRKHDHVLPGWSELKKAAGDTPESRTLFADILADDECRAVLLAAFDTTPEGRKAFERRWENKMNGWLAARRQQNRTELMTKDEPIRFLAAGWLGDLLAGRDYRSYFRQPVADEYLKSDEGQRAQASEGKYGGAVIKLARAWIDAQTQVHGLRDAVWLAGSMKFEESLRLRCHERILDLGFSDGSLGALARTGDRKYLATMKRFFAREELLHADVNRDARLPKMQVRDVALAFSVEMTGQDVAEYEFSVQQDTKKWPSMKYISNNYFFRGDKEKTAEQKREAAFKKWAEWEKANPLPAAKDKK